MENTFDPSDVFDERTIKMFQNKSLVQVFELKTFYFGRCFTIVRASGISQYNFDLKYGLKATRDAVAYVHAPGTDHLYFYYRGRRLKTFAIVKLVKFKIYINTGCSLP